MSKPRIETKSQRIFRQFVPPSDMNFVNALRCVFGLDPIPAGNGAVQARKARDVRCVRRLS